LKVLGYFEAKAWKYCSRSWKWHHSFKHL